MFCHFIALQSIFAQKDPLRAMVTYRGWTLSAFAKKSKGKRFIDDALDSMFWKECATIVQITEPLLHVLRIVDSDEKPSMGYCMKLFTWQKVRWNTDFKE